MIEVEIQAVKGYGTIGESWYYAMSWHTNGGIFSHSYVISSVLGIVHYYL